jgi:hypothetical protein
VKRFEVAPPISVSVTTQVVPPGMSLMVTGASTVRVSSRSRGEWLHSSRNLNGPPVPPSTAFLSVSDPVGASAHFSQKTFCLAPPGASFESEVTFTW